MAARIANSRLRPVGAHKEKIGDVGAGDEQNEADGPEQDEERLTSAGDDGVAQRLDPEAALVSISSG